MDVLLLAPGILALLEIGDAGRDLLCMTDAQKRLLLSRFPWAAKKTISLGVEAEMHGHDVPDEVFIDLARGLQKRIVSVLDDSGLESEPFPLRKVADKR